MSEFKEITSLQNPLVKKILTLKDKSRERKKTGLFVLEGKREVALAIKGGYTIETVLYCDVIIPKHDLLQLFDTATIRPEFISISKAVYQKIAYRQTTEGLVAISIAKQHDLQSLQFKSKNPLILVAEAPEKPGNMGALLRTADAANLDAVLIANLKGDVYNPNSIRSSVGCLFTNQIATASTTEIIAYLKEKGVAIYCAELTTSTPYTSVNFSKPAAIVVGTEAIGLSQEWLASATQNIIIPMRGEIDSMNVSVSAAIVIFEAIRQREI